MCSIKNLSILVVEPNEDEMHKTCRSLELLGVTTVICVDDYTEALAIVEKDKNIDLVIADLELNKFSSTGLFLCAVVKKKRPDMLFLISSRGSGVSFLCQSFTGRALQVGADGTIDKSYENELENVLPKWLELAVAKRNTDEIINKRM